MKATKNNGRGKSFKAFLLKPILLIWVGGICVLVAGSLVPEASIAEPSSDFLGIDKALRVLTFAVLSFFPVVYFASLKMGLILASFVAPLGFMLEIAQRVVPGRHFSPQDMIANNIGAIFGIALALAIRFLIIRWSRRKKAA